MDRLARMYIKDFFTALIKDWVALMSGAASVLFTVWSIAFEPRSETLKVVLWWLAVAGIVVAFYRIWASERKALIEEREKKFLPELNGKFHPLFVGAFSGDLNGSPIMGTTLTVFLEIFNAGNMPSIIKDWKLLVEISGNPLEAVPVLFDNTLSLGMVNEPALVLDNADRIDNKLAETPIPIGGQARGFLMYMLRGHNRDDIDVAGNKARLQYSDVKGRQYEIVQELGKDQTPTLPPDTSPYFPGLKTRPAPVNVRPKKRERSKRKRR